MAHRLLITFLLAPAVLSIAVAQTRRQTPAAEQISGLAAGIELRPITSRDAALAVESAEVPGGIVDGRNSSFTLRVFPTANVQIFRNGLLVRPVDYVVLARNELGATVTFNPRAIPQPGDLLEVYYRTDDPANGGAARQLRVPADVSETVQRLVAEQVRDESLPYTRASSHSSVSISAHSVNTQASTTLAPRSIEALRDREAEQMSRSKKVRPKRERIEAAEKETLLGEGFADPVDTPSNALSLLRSRVAEQGTPSNEGRKWWHRSPRTRSTPLEEQ